MRRLASSALLLLLLPGLLLAQPKRLLTVQVSGEHVEYDQEARTLAIHGRVTITAQTDRPGTPTVAIASGEVEADLANGRIIAHDGVRLLSQQFAMRGEKLELNLERNEFRLERGALGLELTHPLYTEQQVRGFIFGDQVYKQADVIYIIEGRVTTCDRQRPHYSVGVSRFTFDTRSYRMLVRTGRLSLYGRSLVIPGHYESKGKRAGSTDRLNQMMPGYSGYDGLYLPVSYDLAPNSRDWDLTATTRIGTAFAFPGEIRAARVRDQDTFEAFLTRREHYAWDIDQSSRVSRLPEVIYRRSLLPDQPDDDVLEVDVSAGLISEHPWGKPEIFAGRAAVNVEYTPHARARRQRLGSWWALGGTQSLYDSGDRRRDLRAEVGLGQRLGRRGHVAAWFVHHEASGRSPFYFDDIYAENELFVHTNLPLARRWYLEAEARLDTDKDRVRDWSLALHRQMHCLTWGLRYDRGDEMVSLQLNLSGLTGGTPPYASQPLVAPEEVPALPEMVPSETGVKPWLFSLPPAAP